MWLIEAYLPPRSTPGVNTAEKYMYPFEIKESLCTT